MSGDAHAHRRGPIERAQRPTDCFHPRSLPSSPHEINVAESYGKSAFVTVEIYVLSRPSAPRVMSRSRKDAELRLDERLRDSLRQPTSMSLPLAVHHKLDTLAELGADTNPTRAEIIAALIATAPTDPEVVEQLVLRYRKMTVGDLIPAPAAHHGEREDNVVHMPWRAPGRPKQGGAA